jgi:hypothetical protein
MRRTFVISVLMALFFIANSSCFATDEIEDLLYSGAAVKRHTQQGLLELIAETETQLKSQPEDYKLNWILAALTYFYGDFYAVNSAEKKKYFTICKEYSEKAVKANPNGIAGHYWRGVGIAKWAEYNGILYSLFTVGDVLNEMNIVIKLDPNFFSGLPYAIRASVYAYAPGIISVGDGDKARADIRTVLGMKPQFRPVYMIIANIYVAWHEWQNARNIIDEGLKLPFKPKGELEENDCISKLKAVKDKVDIELSKMQQ